MTNINTDGVELSDDDADHGPKEAENITSPRIVIGCVAFLKEFNSRVNPVFSNSLKIKLFPAFKLYVKACCLVTCRVLGAPTMLAMAEDRLALNPPAYLCTNWEGELFSFSYLSHPVKDIYVIVI